MAALVFGIFALAFTFAAAASDDRGSFTLGAAAAALFAVLAGVALAIG